VRLSDDARRGWERLALRYGVTMSALMEAVGVRLMSGEGEPVPAELIELARKIDYERRRR
jgi:cytochrome c oxidase subunit IV